MDDFSFNNDILLKFQNMVMRVIVSALNYVPNSVLQSCEVITQYSVKYLKRGSTHPNVFVKRLQSKEMR